MFVRARVPRYCAAAHRAAARDCLPALALAVPTGFVLFLGLFVVNLTPHVGPGFPHSIGLTAGALIALTAQAWAITAQYRVHLVDRRRRLGCGLSSRGMDVVFDLPRPRPMGSRMGKP